MKKNFDVEVELLVGGTVYSVEANSSEEAEGIAEQMAVEEVSGGLSLGPSPTVDVMSSYAYESEEQKLD